MTCPACEAIIAAAHADPDFDGHAGSPFEAYYEGRHICKREWRCFHCGKVFTDPVAAREHFGDFEQPTVLALASEIYEKHVTGNLDREQLVMQLTRLAETK